MKEIQSRARYAYLIFSILALAYLLVYFHRLCAAVVAVDIMHDLQAGGTIIGVLATRNEGATTAGRVIANRRRLVAALYRGGARLLMVSNEHPEALERLAPDPALEAKVKAGIKRLKAAKRMRVTSSAGTDLYRTAIAILLKAGSSTGGFGSS